MKHRSFKNVNFVGWIVIILGFSFLYFSYFFVYIPRQEAQLQQRAFRILREYGSNIFDKYDYYQNHFNNYAFYYALRYLGIQSVPQNVKEVMKGLPEFIVMEDLKDSAEKDAEFVQMNNLLHVNFYNDIKKAVLTIPDSLLQDSILVDVLLLEDNLPARVPINEFMKGLKFDRLFENIVLFDSSQVFYNTNLDVLIDVTNSPALCDSIKNVQGGAYMKLNVRGEDKHVMILPIHFRGREFFLAGFISDKVFRNITHTINSQLLIFLAGLLLLIFIGMPVLKVILLSPKERLKSLDASSSIFSAVLGTGLLVLLILSIIKHEVSDRSYNLRRIQLVSDSLYANVVSNINAVKNLYHAVDSMAQPAGYDVRTRLDTAAMTPKETALLGKIENHFFVANNKRFLQDKEVLNYPFPLNEIFLINDKGRMYKAITSTPFSDIIDIDLNQRKYYSSVKDTTKAWPAGNNIKWYLESIQSYNSLGKGETAISFYTSAFGPALPVLAITSSIPALYSQVLPKDIEFLVINDLGKVLYHSIKSKNLHENFLEESEFNTRLAKAVDLRVDATFQLNYNGKKWLARIMPLEDTPLYHITLLDLEPVNNKNARVFLFTFYFFVISLFLLAFGIMIKGWISPGSKEKQSTWLLKWLDFQEAHYLLYEKLALIMSAIIVLQAAGIFFLKKPLSVLFYQFFFMIYSLYIAAAVLKKKSVGKKNTYFYALFILFIFVVELLLLWQEEALTELIILAVTLFSVIPLTLGVTKNLKDYQKKKDAETGPIQKQYILFLFLWLTALSIVPVIQIYFSVKNTETRLWKQERLFKIANDNLHLYSEYDDHEASWFRKIQGNGLDFLRISYPDTFPNPPDNSRLTRADRIYSKLFDPITGEYLPLEIFKGKNYTDEWIVSDSLFFSKAGEKGKVRVVADGSPKVDYFQLIIIILLAGLAVFGFLWLLVNYLASVMFNLHPEEQPKPGPFWSDVLAHPGKRRILLKSFNGDCFYRNSKDYLVKQNTELESVPGNNDPRPLYISEMMEFGFKLQDYLMSHAVVWISGLENAVYQIEEHEKLLSVLVEVNQSSAQKVVVDLPFDLALINEYYDDYIAENELKPEEKSRVYLLKKRWNDIFKRYFEFDGYIDLQKNAVLVEKVDEKARNDEVKTKCQQEMLADMDTWYRIIWANLTNIEKIILFDLADDGLVNRKNKLMISRLMKKKLIIANASLELFSDGFRDYVLTKLSSSRVKAIEKELGLKGKWRNVRYLILFILIPLGAFIFISQGIPVEKIFGIIGGALAAITALLRLFDSSAFRQSSS